jgi:hypothetical protein
MVVQWILSSWVLRGDTESSVGTETVWLHDMWDSDAATECLFNWGTVLMCLENCQLNFAVVIAWNGLVYAGIPYQNSFYYWISYWYLSIYGAGVAQSVYCLTMDWMTGRSSSIPSRGKRIFRVTSCVQTGSGPHPASCPVGTQGASFSIFLMVYPCFTFKNYTSTSKLPFWVLAVVS